MKPPLEVRQLLEKAAENDGKYRMVSGVVVSQEAVGKNLLDGNFRVLASANDRKVTLKKRQVLAKVMKRGIIEQSSLTLNSGITHVENGFKNEVINLVDSSLMRDGDASKFVEVQLNNNFSAVNMPKKRRIVEEFNFADKRLTAFEITRSQILEGATLSCIGKVSVDSTGQVKMSQLMAIVAGGVYEARKHLNEQIQHQKSASFLLGFAATFLLGTSLALYCRIKQIHNSRK